MISVKDVADEVKANKGVSKDVNMRGGVMRASMSEGTENGGQFCPEDSACLLTSARVNVYIFVRCGIVKSSTKECPTRSRVF